MSRGNALIAGLVVHVGALSFAAGHASGTNPAKTDETLSVETDGSKDAFGSPVWKPPADNGALGLDAGASTWNDNQTFGPRTPTTDEIHGSWVPMGGDSSEYLTTTELADPRHAEATNKATGLGLGGDSTFAGNDLTFVPRKPPAGRETMTLPDAENSDDETVTPDDEAVPPIRAEDVDADDSADLTKKGEGSYYGERTFVPRPASVRREQSEKLAPVRTDDAAVTGEASSRPGLNAGGQSSGDRTFVPRSPPKAMGDMITDDNTPLEGENAPIVRAEEPGAKDKATKGVGTAAMFLALLSLHA